MTTLSDAALLGKLQATDVFRGLSVDHLDTIEALGHRMAIPLGTVLIDSSEPSNDLYAIFDGRAGFFTPSAIGEMMVRVAGPGEVFPVAAFIGSEQLITSARAMTEMDVFVVPVPELRYLCDAEPEIGRNIYRNVAEILAGRYRATADRLAAAAEYVVRGGTGLAEQSYWRLGSAASLLTWREILALPEGARREEVRRLSELLLSLDERAGQAMAEGLIADEFALLEEQQTIATQSRALAWLEMDPVRAQAIAAIYEQALRRMPAAMTLRQLTALRTLWATLGRVERERLEGLFPGTVLRP